MEKHTDDPADPKRNWQKTPEKIMVGKLMHFPFYHLFRGQGKSILQGLLL